MKPVCFGDGTPVAGHRVILPEDLVMNFDEEEELPELRPLPPFGPSDIHKVSVRVPDLSVNFPGELETDWKHVTTEWQENDFEHH